MKLYKYKAVLGGIKPDGTTLPKKIIHLFAPHEMIAGEAATKIAERMGGNFLNLISITVEN